MECSLTKGKVNKVMENMLRNCPLNMIYYNLVFTDKEIVVDYLSKTYRSWILHVKPIKEYEYDSMTAIDILKKSNENLIIKYKDIEQIIFKKRTFFTNARVEIKAKTLEGKLVLFSKNRIDVKGYYDLVQSYLKEKAELK